MTEVTCACGQVALQLAGRHIVSAECLCSDCQQAAAEFRGLPGARAVADDNGATRFVLHRKDRVHCERGQDRLRAHRLTKDSKTLRVIATCCNTPMFLDVTQAHWLSVYGTLWPTGTLPKLNMRVMTKHAPAGVILPDDVPNLPSHSALFFIRLVWAWVAMGFRVPKFEYVEGTRDEDRQ